MAWTAGFRYSQRALEGGARPVRLSFTGSSNHLHQTLLRLSGSQRALRASSSSTPALSETQTHGPRSTPARASSSEYGARPPVFQQAPCTLKLENHCLWSVGQQISASDFPGLLVCQRLILRKSLESWQHFKTLHLVESQGSWNPSFF